MAQKRITWSDYDREFLSQITKGIGIPGEPIDSLASRYGERPNEMFIREAMSFLLANWLAADTEACSDIADSARKHGLGNKEITDNARYLASCRNSKYLRIVILTKFLAASRATKACPKVKIIESTISELNHSKVFEQVSPSILREGSLAKNAVSNPVLQEGLPNDGDQKSLGKSLLGRLSQRGSALQYLVIAILSSAFAATFASIALSHNYSRTVRLGEDKHVKLLLALPESGPDLQDYLHQLNDFRKSNWRNYLSKSSMIALDQKGLLLNRAIEVEALRSQIKRLPAGKPDLENVSSVKERLSKIQNANAFEYLEVGEKDRLNLRLLDVSAIQQEIARLKAEEEQRARQRAELERRTQAEAEARRRQAEEAQAAAAEAAAARQAAQESSQNEASVYQIGPRGGCFYWSGNSKVYVDKSNCY